MPESRSCASNSRRTWSPAGAVGQFASGCALLPVARARPSAQHQGAGADRLKPQVAVVVHPAFHGLLDLAQAGSSIARVPPAGVGEPLSVPWSSRIASQPVPLAHSSGAASDRRRHARSSRTGSARTPPSLRYSGASCTRMRHSSSPSRPPSRYKNLGVGRDDEGGVAHHQVELAPGHRLEPAPLEALHAFHAVEPRVEGTEGQRALVHVHSHGFVAVPRCQQGLDPATGAQVERPAHGLPDRQIGKQAREGVHAPDEVAGHRSIGEVSRSPRAARRGARPASAIAPVPHAPRAAHWPPGPQAGARPERPPPLLHPLLCRLGTAAARVDSRSSAAAAPARCGRTAVAAVRPEPLLGVARAVREKVVQTVEDPRVSGNVRCNSSYLKNLLAPPFTASS